MKFLAILSVMVMFIFFLILILNLLSLCITYTGLFLMADKLQLDHP